jgi:osmoprotectant transport system ATP-binding protein
MTTTDTPRADETAAEDRGAERREVSGAEIRLEDVTKRYAGQETAAVDGLSMVIPAGEIVMFVGPSGCGKTTSLKMINRLIEPTSGSIHIGDTDIRDQSADDLRRQIGYVIQGGSLFPHMTVAKNIAIVPRLLGWDRARISERVDELLDLVGLDAAKYRDRYPRELSGGQQQRVGVARGLAADPPVILMDEPFGAVDPITRVRLQDELLSIQRELRKTIVCVTHDIDEAIKLGDRILILREGAQVAQYDTAEAILANPANEFVEDFVGAGSALKQLSLSRISEIALRRPTTATVGESTAEARRRAEANGDKSVVVLDGNGRPTAWPWLRQLKGDTIHAGADDLVNLDQRATLNDALDTMLTSRHGGVVVTGNRDQYLGVVDFEAVTAYIRQQQEAMDGSASDGAATAESNPADAHDDDAAAGDGAGRG